MRIVNHWHSEVCQMFKDIYPFNKSYFMLYAAFGLF